MVETMDKDLKRFHAITAGPKELNAKIRDIRKQIKALEKEQDACIKEDRSLQREIQKLEKQREKVLDKEESIGMKISRLEDQIDSIEEDDDYAPPRPGSRGGRGGP